MAGTTNLILRILGEDKATEVLEKVKKNVDTLEKTTGGLRDRFQSLSQTFSSMGKSFSIAGGVLTGAMTLMVRSVVSYEEQLDKLNKTTGITVEKLSLLGYTAEQEHASVEALAMGLKFLQQSMVQAEQGSKLDADAFQYLGISLRNAQGQLKPTDELLLEIADRFAGLQDESTKTAIAMQIFGRSGYELIPYLNQGRESIEAQMQQAKELGLVYSTDMVDAGKAFGDTLTALQASLKRLQAEFVSGLIPVLEPLVQELTVIISHLKEWMTQNPELTQQIGKLVLGLTAFLAIGGPVALALSMVFKVMASGMGIVTSLGKVIIWITSLFGPWGTVILALIPAITLLIRNWDLVKMAVTNVGHTIANFSTVVLQGLSKTLEVVSNFVKDLGAKMYEAGKEFLVSWWNGLVSSWDKVKQWLSDLALKIFQFFGGGHSPALVGPLSNLEVWGERFASAYLEGMSKGFEKTQEVLPVNYLNSLLYKGGEVPRIRTITRETFTPETFSFGQLSYFASFTKLPDVIKERADKLESTTIYWLKDISQTIKDTGNKVVTAVKGIQPKLPVTPTPDQPIGKPGREGGGGYILNKPIIPPPIPWISGPTLEAEPVLTEEAVIEQIKEILQSEIKLPIPEDLRSYLTLRVPETASETVPSFVPELQKLNVFLDTLVQINPDIVKGLEPLPELVLALNDLKETLKETQISVSPVPAWIPESISQIEKLQLTLNTAQPSLEVPVTPEVTGEVTPDILPAKLILDLTGKTVQVISTVDEEKQPEPDILPVTLTLDLSKESVQVLSEVIEGKEPKSDLKPLTIKLDLSNETVEVYSEVDNEKEPSPDILPALLTLDLSNRTVLVQSAVDKEKEPNPEIVPLTLDLDLKGQKVRVVPKVDDDKKPEPVIGTAPLSLDLRGQSVTVKPSVPEGKKPKPEIQPVEVEIDLTGQSVPVQTKVKEGTKPEPVIIPPVETTPVKPEPVTIPEEISQGTLDTVVDFMKGWVESIKKAWEAKQRSVPEESIAFLETEAAWSVVSILAGTIDHLHNVLTNKQIVFTDKDTEVIQSQINSTANATLTKVVQSANSEIQKLNPSVSEAHSAKQLEVLNAQTQTLYDRIVDQGKRAGSLKPTVTGVNQKTGLTGQETVNNAVTNLYNAIVNKAAEEANKAVPKVKTEPSKGTTPSKAPSQPEIDILGLKDFLGYLDMFNMLGITAQMTTQELNEYNKAIAKRTKELQTLGTPPELAKNLARTEVQLKMIQEFQGKALTGQTPLPRGKQQSTLDRILSEGKLPQITISGAGMVTALIMLIWTLLKSSSGLPPAGLPGGIPGGMRNGINFGGIPQVTPGVLYASAQPYIAKNANIIQPTKVELYPEVADVINRLSGQVFTESMRNLVKENLELLQRSNYEVLNINENWAEQKVIIEQNNNLLSEGAISERERARLAKEESNQLKETLQSLGIIENINKNITNLKSRQNQLITENIARQQELEIRKFREAQITAEIADIDSQILSLQNTEINSYNRVEQKYLQDKITALQKAKEEKAKELLASQAGTEIVAKDVETIQREYDALSDLVSGFEMLKQLLPEDSEIQERLNQLELIINKSKNDWALGFRETMVTAFSQLVQRDWKNALTSLVNFFRQKMLDNLVDAFKDTQVYKALGDLAGSIGGAIGATGFGGAFLGFMGAEVSSKVLEKILNSLNKFLAVWDKFIEPVQKVVDFIYQKIGNMFLSEFMPIQRELVRIVKLFVYPILRIGEALLQVFEPFIPYIEQWLIALEPIIQWLGERIVQSLGWILTGIARLVKVFDYQLGYNLGQIGNQLINWQFEISDAIDSFADTAGGGVQVSEITGPTRDLLVELLSPIRSLDLIPGSMESMKEAIFEMRDAFLTYAEQDRVTNVYVDKLDPEYTIDKMMADIDTKLGQRINLKKVVRGLA